MHSYAVDSPDGYTAQFLALNDAKAMERARQIVADRFYGVSGPFVVWNLEGDVRVGEFS